MPETRNGGDAIELRPTKSTDQEGGLDAQTLRPPVEADPSDGEKGAGPTGPAGRPIRRLGPRTGGTPA